MNEEPIKIVPVSGVAVPDPYKPTPVKGGRKGVAPPAAGVKPTEPAKTYPSETSKWRHLITPYIRGNVVELASGGDPVVPYALQVELSPESYATYNSNQPLRGPVQWRDDKAIFNLPFKNGVVDTLFSSHLLEDFADWEPLLKEWVRVLKRPGGRLIICVPDKKRWSQAVANGQPPNCSHRHESYVGELSSYAPRLGLSVIVDKLTDVPKGDYNIAFVAETI